MSTDAASAVGTPPNPEAEPTDLGDSPDGGGDRLSAWLGRLTGPRVLQAGALLVLLQLVLRGWVAASGDLWQDDMIVTGRAAQMPVLSSEYLLYDHDGHFMPAGFLLTGAFTHLAPLQWWPMLITLVLMQVLASLAVLRVLRLLLGDRPVLLIPLALYLFSPLTLPAFAWWIAAVNALPLQAGMAWVVGDAIKLLRTGRTRYAVTGTVVFAVTLSFFEKSLIVAPVAFAVVALLQRFDGDEAPFLSTLRRVGKLWAGIVVVVGFWAWVYSAVVGSPAIAAEDAGTVPQAIRLVGGGVLRGLIPALVGGPLTWADPGLFAAPSNGLVIISCAVVAGALAWTSWTRHGCGVIWWLVVAYLVINGAAMVVGRLSTMTPDVLSLSLRYFADSTLVIALAMALVLVAPKRADRPGQPLMTQQGRRVVGAAAAVAFLVASLWTTVTFTRIWSDSPTRAYLTAAKESLDNNHVPLLEQAVPDTVVWALAFPHNLASQVFGPITDRDEFGKTTTELRIIDQNGHMIDGRVEPLRWVKEGPLKGCGYGISGSRETDVDLDGPLIPWAWTVQLNYTAGADGVLEVSLDGDTLRTPVSKGLHSVFLRLDGGGETLHVRSRTAGLGVCIDSGVVGNMVPAGSN